MKLGEIINYIKPLKVLNNIETVEITGVSYNSKTTQKGDIFVCLVGEKSDGHVYAKMAVENGAVAVLAQKEIEDVSVPVLVVNDTQFEIATLACLFYDFPSSKLNLIGITGTNGKTTVTHLVERLFEANNKECGLIGTLGYKLNSTGVYKDAKHTTPQAVELQKTFKTMLDNNIKNVSMEVSSHALEQHRVGGCEFNGAVLTNLTQDHLDYHITMGNYFKAKAKLFENLKEGSYAVINLDDEWADKFLKVIPSGVNVFTYSIKSENSSVKAYDLNFSTGGAEFNCSTPLGIFKIKLLMTGLFSVYNALAALTVSIAEGLDINTSIKTLEETQGVAGRFEAITVNPLTIVDYAHTPDGLENVLKTAKEILPSENSNLICVFGCGGDRDATKRPKMAHIAEQIADKIIITSDNPRSEDPQQIITDILSGINSYDTEKIFVEIDRHEAIKLASKISKPEDIVVVAGKGHEDYQILKDKTIHFDDREEVRKAFN